jgi:glycosyltransferase involved in cell wall biosynthesis
MRILHVLKDLTNCGNGVTNAAVDMAIVQRELGYCVAVASSGGEYQSLLESQQVIHYRLFKGDRYAFMRRNCFRLRRVIRNFNPDVVHCHLPPGLMLAWLLRFSQRYRLVAHVHNVEDKRAKFMGFADAVIAVSRSVADSMAKKGIPDRKLHVVTNCVVGSPRRKALGKVSDKPLAQPAIVTVAGMNRRKNIDGLIEAFAQIANEFPDANLYLVGEGCDRGLFEAMAARSPFAKRIHFEGFQKDPRAYIQNARIFVLASRRDSCPLVLHEARELGAAIIGTDVDGIGEALDHGKAGVLIPANDVSYLTTALRKLLSEPETVERWRQASKAGLENHTVTRMARELLEIYRQVLGERASGRQVGQVGKVEQRAETVKAETVKAQNVKESLDRMAS